MTHLRYTGAAVAALLVCAVAGHAQTPATAVPIAGAVVRDTAAQQRADSVLDAQTREIAQRLRCPVCQGESIQDSPAELAQQMRAVVRSQLQEGRTPDEIKAYFVSKYGEWILLEPAMTGLNMLLYAFPVVIVLGGLAFVVRFVMRSSAAPTNAP